MYSRYYKVTFLAIGLLLGGFLSAQPGSSVAADGKPYTVHVVSAGETFYSISQIYKVHVDSLRSVNRLTDIAAAIRPGDKLIIPYSARTTNVSTAVAPGPAPKPVAPVTPPTSNGAYLQHTVKTGETLYSVARLYPHTTVASIKEANNLTVDGLSIGQVLLILSQTSATTTITKPTPPPSQQPVDGSLYHPSGNTTASNANDATVSDYDDNATVASFDMKMLSDLEAKFKANNVNGKLETIRGTATWIDDPSHENQYRFYAMHKTAPIGSVVMVKNLMNNKVIYAKVIGKLPNNKINENIIVKVSGGAARYLNVLDDRFMVELSVPSKL